jgi:putative SOS response-associated peptidase YedK
MCGRFTHRYTWADIHRLYRLISPASNVQPSYNICPTDTVNVVTSSQDVRILQPMRASGRIPRSTCAHVTGAATGKPSRARGE